MNSRIDERKTEFIKKKLPFQPTPVFVGTLNGSDSVLSDVVLSDQRFGCESPRAAVEFTFKLFFVLNAQYPAEAKLIWQFFRKAIYDLSLPTDQLVAVSLYSLLGYVKA